MKLNILIVEDDNTNIKILDFYLKEYFQSHKSIKQFHIDVANNGWEALGMLSVKRYDLVLLDVMMPKCDGFKVLNTFNLTNKSSRPYICMITGLGESKHTTLFKLKGANSYIIKPFDKDIFINILDKFVELELNLDEENEDLQGEFEDFDDFYDLDDEFDSFENSEQSNMMDEFNASHKKLPASEFLQDYDNIEYILEDISELDADIDDIVDQLFAENLENNLEDIVQLFQKYAQFLDSFIDFQELSKSLKLLSELLEESKFSSLDEKSLEFIASFIKAILQDLQDWKEHVFVLQDAVDVYYINASSLSSCMQLDTYIKNLKV